MSPWRHVVFDGPYCHVKPLKASFDVQGLALRALWALRAGVRFGLKGVRIEGGLRIGDTVKKKVFLGKRIS